MSRFGDLIAGQYANDVKFIEHVGGLYFGQDFSLANAPTNWRLRLGRYNGRYHGTSVDLHGYWIYRTDVNKCWQAVNRGRGDLRYWNEDGLAAGNPEDWELFAFGPVDENASTVKIYNVSYGPYQAATGGNVNKCMNYVNLVGNRFYCNDTVTNAAIFKVEF